MKLQIALVLLSLCSLLEGTTVEAQRVAVEDVESMHALKKAVEKLSCFEQESRVFSIRVKHKLFVLQEELERLTSDVKALKSDLGKLKELLRKQGDTILVQGKSIPRKSLEAMVDEQIAKMKAANRSIGNIESSIKKISTRKRSLEEQKAAVVANRRKYEERIKELEQVQKRESESRPWFDEFDSFDEWFKQLSLSVNPVKAQKPELNRRVGDGFDSIDQILEGEKSPRDVSKEIDEILGGN